jgi:hypothetical protein
MKAKKATSISKINYFEIKYQPMNHDDIIYDEDFAEDNVHVFIDGRCFLEMVKEFELPFTTRSAGMYSINLYQYNQDYLLGHWLDDDIGKTRLLACSCGDLGCGSLAARIRVEKDCVIWDQFEHPWKNWDYSGFGPFIFALDEYQKAIEKIPFIKKLLASHWN